MFHFCTYFDRNYIHKGLALYHSLVAQGEPFELWVLCFDEETFSALETLRLTGVRLIRQSDFEANDPELREVKHTRSRVEYYWSCTPSLPLYVLDKDPAIETVIYLDADLFFYASPTAVMDELSDGNVLIVPHDYAAEFADREVNGTYNVGVVAFRRSEEGLRCLRWWREKCVEWCYYSLDGGQMGDQKYLDEWPHRFQGVRVSRNPGINAAPWNIGKYGAKMDAEGRILVSGQPLICYHFHNCSICTSRLARIAGSNVAIRTADLALIYRPYLDALVRAERLLARKGIRIQLPKSGFPWKYVVARIARRQPVRHFIRMPVNVD